MPVRKLEQSIVSKMKIVAFLQNQWFKNPDRVKRLMDRNPEAREWYIKKFLFMGCLTGRRLQGAFGEELCSEIVWEETSRNIGGASNSVFPADEQHIEKVIEKHNPEIILAFGKVAQNGLWCKSRGVPVFNFPHPAARGEKSLQDFQQRAELFLNNLQSNTMKKNTLQQATKKSLKKALLSFLF